MRPVKGVIIGTGRLAFACAEACYKTGLDITCVEPEKNAFSPLRTFCTKNGVRYFCILDRSEISSFFVRLSVPTLVISAYNGFLFPKSVLANHFLNIINFHNSLLPKHRGRNAPTWTIFEMDKISGITWHKVILELDRGATIFQRSFDLTEDMTAIELTQKTLDVGSKTFLDILPSLLDGSYAFQETAFSCFDSVHKSTEVPNSGILDLAWKVQKIYAFLRSLDYGKFRVLPSATVNLLGSTWHVVSYSAKHLQCATSSDVSLAKNTLVIIDGHLELTITLQLERSGD